MINSLLICTKISPNRVGYLHSSLTHLRQEWLVCSYILTAVQVVYIWVDVKMLISQYGWVFWPHGHQLSLREDSGQYDHRVTSWIRRPAVTCFSVHPHLRWTLQWHNLVCSIVAQQHCSQIKLSEYIIYPFPSSPTGAQQLRNSIRACYFAKNLCLIKLFQTISSQFKTFLSTDGFSPKASFIIATLSAMLMEFRSKYLPTECWTPAKWMYFLYRKPIKWI